MELVCKCGHLKEKHNIGKSIDSNKIDSCCLVIDDTYGPFLDTCTQFIPDNLESFKKKFEELSK